LASQAVENCELRNRVVKWKSQFFGSTWAKYEQAIPGTFRLCPPPERREALQRDYRAMRDIYLSELVSFGDILSTPADLEGRINLVGGE